MVRRIILFLALILFLVFPLAKADFTIQSNLETNTVCPSNTIIINEIISSDQDASFSVSVSGSAAQFTTAIPSGFFLQAGKTQPVFLYITPSSRIIPGTYNLVFQVISQGITKTISHNVLVENCHKTSIITNPVYQKSCTCEKKNIQLIIKNDGKYLEDYTLAAEGPLSSYVTFSTKTFSLAQGQSTAVTAYIQTPCNIMGNYDLIFKINSMSKYAQAESNSKLELVPCYDYVLEIEKNLYETCENQKLSIPIKIKNIGTQENSYSIKTSGPAWISVDQKNLKISSNEEKSFNLIAQPPIKTQGNSSAIIEILSEKGNILQRLNVDLSINSCYSSLVNFEKKQDQICNTLNTGYNIIIKNTGKFKSDFSIILESPSWVKIDKNLVTLNSGEEAILFLTANPPAETKSAVYSVVVKAYDQINKLENQDLLSLTTLSAEECYTPAVSSEKEAIEVPRDSSATLLFTIENKGIKTADYIIELSGTASGFCQINPSSISLESGKAQSLYLYISPSIDVAKNNYILTLTSRLKDSVIASKKTVTIKVTESGQANATPTINQTSGNTSVKSKINLTGFWQKITGFFISLFTFKTSKDQIPANQTENKTTENNKTIEISESVNNPPRLIKNISNIEINSGSQYTIDLLMYFEDEENDKLEFITVKPEDLNVLIQNEKMIISAPENFQGIREIIFYATDGKKMVASNTVTINVTKIEFSEQNKIEEKIEEKPKSSAQSFLKFIATYKSYLILAIIAAIIIVIIMSGLGKKILDFFEEEELPAKNGKK